MFAVVRYANSPSDADRLGNEISKLCGEWLGFHCGFGPGAAREHLRVAHALTNLPKISAAFADGCLSYSKVRAMTRVATPESEDFLMMVAEHGPHVCAETLKARWYAGEEMDMERAVWLLANARGPD